MTQGAGSAEHRFVQKMRGHRLANRWSQERLVEEVAAATGLVLNATVVTKLEWALDPARQHKARGLGLDEAEAIAQTLGLTVAEMASAGGSLAEDRLVVQRLVEARYSHQQAVKKLQQASAECAHAEELLREATEAYDQIGSDRSTSPPEAANEAAGRSLAEMAQPAEAFERSLAKLADDGKYHHLEALRPGKKADDGEH